MNDLPIDPSQTKDAPDAPKRTLIAKHQAVKNERRAFKECVEMRQAFRALVQQAGALQTRMDKIQNDSVVVRDQFFGVMGQRLGLGTLEEQKAKGIEIGYDPQAHEISVFQTVKP